MNYMQSGSATPPMCAVALALMMFVVAAPNVHAESESRPNIVLVLADDLGWTGLGCYGSRFYETPNIDRLAAEGTRFTSAYSAGATCAPSRASIMAGQYTPKHRILYVGPGDYQERWKSKHGDLKRFKMLQPRGETILPEGVKTVAETLKQAGYGTAMFGKWHLGLRDQHPGKRGFDVAIESHGKHFGFRTDPESDQPADRYLSDYLSDQAVAFVKKSAKSKSPFFLYYADFLVHKPFEAKQKYLERYGAKDPSEHQKSPMAAAMIKSLDDSVGKILTALDETGERDNTLFVFVSDNGGLSYEEDGLREANTSNRPLRGRKGSEYEGGIRIPWIVRWPGQTPAGMTCVTPVHHVDLFPTLVAVGKAQSPQHDLHGKDLSLLFRSPGGGLPDRNLYWYLPGYSAFHEPSVIVRRGKWKLIRNLETGDLQLYDTDVDLSETTNLAAREEELATSLGNDALIWLDELDAPRMIPNPDYAGR